MQTQSANDLDAFHRFVGDKVRDGNESSSPEEVLDEWRILYPNPSDCESVAAEIQEAIDDLDRGEVGVPFDEFDREFRTRRNLPAPS